MQSQGRLCPENDDDAERRILIGPSTFLSPPNYKVPEKHPLPPLGSVNSTSGAGRLRIFLPSLWGCFWVGIHRLPLMLLLVGLLTWIPGSQWGGRRPTSKEGARRGRRWAGGRRWLGSTPNTRGRRGGRKLLASRHVFGKWVKGKSHGSLQQFRSLRGLLPPFPHIHISKYKF